MSPVGSAQSPSKLKSLRLNIERFNYKKNGVNLSQGRKEKLARAYRDNEGVTIRFATLALSGNDVLMVSSNTGRKLEKHRNAGKGMLITIPKSNIRKQSGSGIFSAVLPALRASAPTIDKTLGLSPLAGAASEGASQIIKKISGGQLFQIPNDKLFMLAQMSHLLTLKQRRGFATALRLMQDMNFRATQKQVGNGVGSILASIGIPLAIDVIKALTGSGVRGGSAVRTGNRGGGSPRIGLHHLLLEVGKDEVNKGQGLLLGKNSPLKNIPLEGAIL